MELRWLEDKLQYKIIDLDDKNNKIEIWKDVPHVSTSESNK